MIPEQRRPTPPREVLREDFGIYVDRVTRENVAEAASQTGVSAETWLKMQENHDTWRPAP